MFTRSQVDLLPAKTNQHGFTIIEALIVMAILGVLAAMAAPSFRSTIQRFRIDSARDALASSMQLARIEAIRNGRQVILEQIPCVRGNWGCGWVMYVDVDANSVQNANEPTLRQVDELEVGILRFGPAPFNQVRISRFGQFAVGIAMRFDIGPRGVISDNCQSLIFNTAMRQRTVTGAGFCTPAIP